MKQEKSQRKPLKKKKEEEIKKMENFLIQAEEKIKANAEKGQTICYVRIPEEFRYNEYKFMEAFIEYGYGAQLDSFDEIKITW